MNGMLLLAAIGISLLSLIAYCIGAYLLWKQRTHFEDLKAYLDRIMKYGDGLANIQATLKDMAIQHHDSMEEMIHEAKDEILQQIGYTLRWGEVLAKLIRVTDQSPEYAVGNNNLLEKAERMHEIGLQIAEVAFDEKAAIEKDDAAIKVAETEAIQGELDAVKEELATKEP